ncbi:integrase core domain-containing protein [Citricoccus sp. GCM10030269]|uniref:integrase core domain-containing protein n=1 Tax=Citricoccus sp. GCM10030269 TaxID=3273388 RepID=UPI00361AAC4E
MVELLLAKRTELKKTGWDHGPLSVLERLRRQGINGLPSRASTARIFLAAGVVAPEPKKRPRSSYRRFVWPRANDMWQIDGTEYALAGGSKAIVIVVLDDCTRMSLASLACQSENSLSAITVVSTAIKRHGVPVRLLSDNGSAFNTTRRGRRGQLTVYLESQGVKCLTGRPGHPTTQGKNERSHSTLARFLAAHPRAADLVQLQALLDRFEHEYNTERPHQGINQATPAEQWAAVEHAEPPQPPEPTQAAAEWDTSHRRIEAAGALTIMGTTYQLGLAHAGAEVIVMHNHAHIQIFNAEGTEIAAFNKAPRGTRYVGNNIPSGFMALPRYDDYHRHKRSTADETETPTPT